MRLEPGRLRVVGTDATASGAAAQSREETLPSVGPSPGAYIREQRQRRGLSLEQLAAATKIPRPSLEQLEADQFDALPGPVFVRGFLRCAARALGLDPTAVLELLYEQERVRLKARRRERPPTGAHTAVTRPSPSADASVSETAASSTFEAGPVAAQATPSPAAQSKTRMQLGAIARELGDRVDPASLVMWLVIALVIAFVVLAAFNLVGGPLPRVQAS